MTLGAGVFRVSVRSTAHGALICQCVAILAAHWNGDVRLAFLGLHSAFKSRLIMLPPSPWHSVHPLGHWALQTCCQTPWHSRLQARQAALLCLLSAQGKCCTAQKRPLLSRGGGSCPATCLADSGQQLLLQNQLAPEAPLDPKARSLFTILFCS